jgi:UDPglucose 6-dehydrogenase
MANYQNKKLLIPNGYQRASAMHRVVIIGTGYVGLSTAATLAYLGHTVTCIDINRDKIAMLRRGELPFHEPYMQDLLALCHERISYSTDLATALHYSQVAFITVGTPAKDDGSTDLSAITAAATAIGQSLSEGQAFLIVTKSTVPIGTGYYINVMAENAYAAKHGEKPQPHQICVTSNPEFLREGSAVHDSLYPNRIVVGAEEETSLELLRSVYAPLIDQSFIPPVFAPRPNHVSSIPLVSTNRTSSETIKYAANTFLALKISFINQVAGLCEVVGADVTQIAHGIGLDERIGHRFLRAGIGWGGSCFGKDTQALISTADEFGYDMSILRAVFESNQNQHFTVVEKLQKELKVLKGKRIAILGLSFKPETDDIRDAPSLAIIKELLRRGAIVSAHDPVSMPSCQRLHPDLAMTYVSDPSELFTASDAVVLITEWSYYRTLDWTQLSKQMRQRLVIDGRNFLDKALLVAAGYKYIGVGVAEGMASVKAEGEKVLALA